MARLRMYLIDFTAHCADITDMSAHDNLYPAVKIYRRHCHMRFGSANQKECRLVRSEAQASVPGASNKLGE